MAPNIAEYELERSADMAHMVNHKLQNIRLSDVTDFWTELSESMMMLHEVESQMSVTNSCIHEHIKKDYKSFEHEHVNNISNIRVQDWISEHTNEQSSLNGFPCNESSIESSIANFLNVKSSLVDELKAMKIRLGALEKREHEMQYASCMTSRHNNFKPSIPVFTGVMGDYAKFEATFDAFIGDIIGNEDMKLNLLIQHCRGIAKNTIEDYVLLKDGRGYAEARKALKQRFGNAHVISHSMIDSLMKGPPIQPYDGTALQTLCAEMNRCFLTLSYFKYQTTLDNCEVLAKIMQRFPENMQVEWAELAFEITESDREPNFNDLKQFVEKWGRISSNVYARHLFTSCVKATNGLQKQEAEVDKVETANNRRMGINPTCSYCKLRHPLVNCIKFGDLDIGNKRRHMFKTHRCYNCLKQGHIARGCLDSARCVRCGGRHHEMFHVKITTAAISSGPAESRQMITNRRDVSDASHKTAPDELKPMQIRRESEIRETSAVLDDNCPCNNTEQNVGKGNVPMGPVDSVKSAPINVPRCMKLKRNIHNAISLPG